MRSRWGVVSSPSLPSLSGLYRLWRSCAAFVEQRRARRALMGMDDHLLRDIGLRRREIDAAVRGDLPY